MPVPTVTETISVVASVASVALAIVAIRDNRLRNPLPQPSAAPAAPPTWPAAPPPLSQPRSSWLGTSWVAVTAGIVAVLGYSAILANTIDGNATARVVISVATLAVVAIIWVARRVGRPQPSRFLNWLMIVLAVGAIGALPLPWAT